MLKRPIDEAKSRVSEGRRLVRPNASAIGTAAAAAITRLARKIENNGIDDIARTIPGSMPFA
jgi:hypothetical protein